MKLIAALKTLSLRSAPVAAQAARLVRSRAERAIRSRFAYNLFLYLLLPRALYRLWQRGRYEPGYRDDIGERFGWYSEPPLERPTWIHAVSVGETRAAQPIIERLLARDPGRRILLTHMTPTGRATGQDLFGDRVAQCYLPYDFPWAIARFLDHFKPSVGLVMETEVWFNLIRICRERKVPVHLVNARLSERSLRGYERAGELAQQAFAELRSIAAQTESDAARFRSLGGRNVTVVGNVKFDVAARPELVERGKGWRDAWGDRPVFLAASTRVGEEVLLLRTLDRIHAPGLLTVIVPRHPQRFDEVAAILDQQAIPYVRRSSGTPPGPATRVLLGDSMGELIAYYAACDVAFVGGSLLDYGAHNLIEPCALGKPVLVGPSVFNFQEAAELAIQAGAALQVADAQGVAEAVNALLQDPARAQVMGRAGEAFTRAHKGAVDRLFALLGL